MKKIYLGGAIRGIEDPISWRRAATTQLLPLGWEAVDPTKIELYVDNEDDYENACRVVDLDLAAIKDCDVMLALINVPSWGTAMEIFYAHSIGVPVIGWNAGGGSVGPWLRVHCEEILSNFDDVKLFLQNLLVKT